MKKNLIKKKYQEDGPYKEILVWLALGGFPWDVSMIGTTCKRGVLKPPGHLKLLCKALRQTRYVKLGSISSDMRGSQKWNQIRLRLY